MTAGSNLLKDNMDKLERGKIFFYPEPLSQSDPFANPIEAEILIMDENYEKFNKIKRRSYDYAVLKLSPNSIIKAEFVLKCNFDFSSAKDQSNLVCIPSYPSMAEMENLKIIAK
jgi:hypothetical protein